MSSYREHRCGTVTISPRIVIPQIHDAQSHLSAERLTATSSNVVISNQPAARTVLSVASCATSQKRASARLASTSSAYLQFVGVFTPGHQR
jgi:hypothetical protein